MRHRKKKVTLDRPKAARQAMLSNLAASVLLHEKVQTTEAKAKAVRPIVERLITKGKNNVLHTRRQLIKALPTINAGKKILEVLGPKYKNRAGGYTRIVKAKRAYPSHRLSSGRFKTPAIAQDSKRKSHARC